MVYAGKIGDSKYSLGVSGRLKDSNLIMWDQETNSLWSQIKGEALYGKSKGKQLGMLPAIFVSMGTWKRMHPETLVLNLSNVRRRAWFYEDDDLARGKVSVRTRRGRRDMTLGIGLRHGGQTVCVAMPLLHDKVLVEVEVGGVPLAVVWHQKEKAALVYDRRSGSDARSFTVKDQKLVSRDGSHTFDMLTGKALGGEGRPLARFPYLPTYVRAWRTYYPKGRILK